MNSVHIYGNLGADPELRSSQGGMSILKLRIATSERVKKGEEWQDHTEWHSVTLFGKRADGLGKILSKGDKVLVTGKLRTSSYEKDGVKKYSTEIVADDVFLSGGKKGGSGGDSERAPSRGDDVTGSVPEEDLPF